MKADRESLEPLPKFQANIEILSVSYDYALYMQLHNIISKLKAKQTKSQQRNL